MHVENMIHDILVFLIDILTNPINLGLLVFIGFLIYKLLFKRSKSAEPNLYLNKLPRMRRDFTVQELREFDGTGPDGRVLVGVNGGVYDVSKGARFYGPGGPYAAFGGRDASRGLATFSVVPGKDDYDDLSDLDSTEMNSVKEWEEQFKERYDYVGKLLKPGETHTNYSDEEDEGTQQENGAKIKNE